MIKPNMPQQDSSFNLTDEAELEIKEITAEEILKNNLRCYVVGPIECLPSWEPLITQHLDEPYQLQEVQVRYFNGENAHISLDGKFLAIPKEMLLIEMQQENTH